MTDQEKERAEMLAMLKEAALEFEYNLNYKSFYLVDKHGDLETLAKWREAIARWEKA